MPIKNQEKERDVDKKGSSLCKFNKKEEEN